jgi:hypothetical protein
MELLTRLQADEWTVTTGGRTSENINLDERFVKIMEATYGGTRLGRQELHGELIADVEGSLWPRELSSGAGPPGPSTMLRMVPLPVPGRILRASWWVSIRRRASAQGAMPSESWLRGARKGGFTCWRMKAARA